MNSSALPSTPAPGRPKDMEKRTAVLEAAMVLFPSRGYDGVSMDAIAQAAGVSKLTVYSHFADKEALFGAAVTECCAQLLPHQLFVPDPGLPVAEALFQIARPFVDLMMDERAVDRKSTRLNSSHSQISYAVFCLKKIKFNNRKHTKHPPFSTRTKAPSDTTET